MKLNIAVILFIGWGFHACQYSSKNNIKVYSQTDSIKPKDSYTELFFDSVSLEQFIKANKTPDSLSNRMRAFYTGRNYEYGWFFKEGLADYAPAFLRLVDDYIGYSGDSVIYNALLHQLVDSIDTQQRVINGEDPEVLQTELLLTRDFFRYAARAYQGRNQLNAKELEWFIPRKKIDMVGLLDTAIENRGKNFSTYEPVNRQYGLLKNYLLKYNDIEKSGGWTFITADKKTYKQGDSAIIISQVKKRLFLTGDYTLTDTSVFFTPALTKGIKNFQHRYGFTENGIVNASLLNEMKKPVTDRIRQILINMERIRWVPAQPTTDYLLVNIPEYRLHVYEKGNYKWSMNVVTGKAAHNTVIFTGTLKHIVFSPYWNIPPGILKNETLPAIRRNKNYLASHNMEWNGNTVRQKPGPNNALGLVKFLFPNVYNIYLHDTPSKSLFSEDKRAFSHGCIRLSQPTKLALFLLRNNKEWDSTKVVKAMNAGKEKYVNVTETVPVYIGYFTAWVDQEGKLNFRDDIYGHDRKMAAHLFSNK
jgi:murein L,D-transpeptidase YcbB/YkuD